MNKISEKVLQKIKKDHIKPAPKWQFVVRDGGQWTAFALLIILVVIAFALLWYFWSEGPWLHGGRFGFGLIFGRMPILLVVVFILMSGLALFDFRNTGKGYRFSIFKISLILALVAGVFGWSINYFGMSARMDRTFGNMPYYQNRESYMRDVWQKPENGLIAGEIMEINNNKNYVLRDFDGRIWHVDASQALWRHDIIPEIGLRVKLIGKASYNNFTAEEVRPWMRNGACPMMEGVGTCGMTGR